MAQSTIDSEGFKRGTRGSPIIPRDAVSRTANVERTGRHKWVKSPFHLPCRSLRSIKDWGRDYSIKATKINLDQV